jgi:hypothetical protein
LLIREELCFIFLKGMSFVLGLLCLPCIGICMLLGGFSLDDEEEDLEKGKGKKMEGGK